MQIECIYMQIECIYSLKYTPNNEYVYSLLHLECHSISISNLNLTGLFSTNRGNRDAEN